MSIGLEIALEIVKAATGVLLTLFGAVVAYYLKKEYREHRKNTAVRRYLVGDPTLEEVDDEGQLDEIDTRFDQLRADMEEQHAEVHEQLTKVHRLTERIAAQLEAHDGFDFMRGGSNAGDRQATGDPGD